MLTFLSAIMLAQAPPLQRPSPDERRRIARETLEQLLAEDESPSVYQIQAGEYLVVLNSRPRASKESGICQYDSLSMKRPPAEKAPGDVRPSIRDLKLEHYFRVLTDTNDSPLLEIGGHELERACSAIAPQRYGWFLGDDAWAAKRAIIGLAEVAAELRKPASTKIKWECGSYCPDRAELSKRISPTDPGIAQTRDLRRRCLEGAYCVTVWIDDPICGFWETQLHLEGLETDRLRSASIGRMLGTLECSEMESQE